LTLSLSVAGCSSSSDETESSTSPSSESTTAESTPSETEAPAETEEAEETSGAADITAAPATGISITGDGYIYSVPEGWELQDPAIAPGTDTIVADMTATGDFANNVNVILNPGAITMDQVEESAPSQLEASGGSEVSVRDRVNIAGSESAHISAKATADGVSYVVHQYYPTNDDQTYVVTFSYDDTVAEADAISIAESILASWTWS
jgi:hypothetical protein